MRNSLLFLAVAAATCGAAHAQVTFIPLQTPEIKLTKISGNGAYAVGSIYATAAFRWSASGGTEELITTMDDALGINNFGTIAGAMPVDGGSPNGGTDLGAFVAVGATPVGLTGPLQENSNAYDIADDGTVVGLSSDNAGTMGITNAYVWTAAAGMSALSTLRPQTYSRANAISSDGHVIVGWNDQDNGGRTAVVWQDRVPFDVADADGNLVGEASAVSSNGVYVVGGSYTDSKGNSGSWRWSAATGVQMIPTMGFAFGVSDDGKTVVGSNGFFDDPPRAAMIWHEGSGTVALVDWLSAQGVSIPDGWDPGLAGGFGGISGDGSLMGGWTFGASGTQSYLVRSLGDAIFANGFEDPATH
jgi:probable HAF family extracellular repeat protein